MEIEFVNRLRESVSDSSSFVSLGIGDDAALLATRGNDTVVTVDMLTEGVDFLLEQADPELIGRKALAVNLSDIAAMAAIPTAIVVAVSLPRKPCKTGVGTLSPLELAEKLLHGIQTLARHYDVAIAGGDTNSWDGGLVVAITAFGTPTERGITRRSGAKPGDRIFVTGPLGGSILGRHFTFEPRVREALTLHSRYDIHAAIDISDGLSLDLSRLIAESKCGAILWETAIPISDDARRMKDSMAPLEHALYDGEDFELLFTVDPETAESILRDPPLGNPVFEIGEIAPGDTVIRMFATDGVMTPHQPRGYLH